MFFHSVTAKPESRHMSPGPGVTVTGMGNLLQKGAADIAMTTTYLLGYRIQRLTALLPIGNEPIFIYFIQPKASTAKNIFDLPFSQSTWYATSIAAACFVCFSIIFTRFGFGIHPDRNWWSSQHVFWILCVGCQHGESEIPSLIQDLFIFEARKLQDQPLLSDVSVEIKTLIQNYVWTEWHFRPPSFSGKLLLLTCLFLSLVIYSAYSGSMISGIYILTHG